MCASHASTGPCGGQRVTVVPTATPVTVRGRKAADRWEKAMSYKAHMYGGGESYSGVIPAKQPNKSGRPPAEVVEGRPLTEECSEAS